VRYEARRPFQDRFGTDPGALGVQDLRVLTARQGMA